MRWMPPVVLVPTLVALAVLLAAPASTASDLTGKWRIEDENANVEFADVIDMAGAVSLDLTGGGTGLPFLFAGTFDGSTLALSATDGLCEPPADCTIDATVFPGADFFDGRFLSRFFVFSSRTLGSRCECFDGNTTNGDGCDAACRVEPCFTCTGMPSSCSPTPDGGSCSDGSACTTAETCTAGVCNGNPVTPCVDLSGLWNVTSDSGAFGTFEDVVRIEQRDTFVLRRGASSGVPLSFGTIVPGTGAFTLEKPVLTLTCVETIETNPLSGTTTGPRTFEASGSNAVAAGVHCLNIPYTEIGTRAEPAPAPTLTLLGGIAFAALLALAMVWKLRSSYA